MISKVSSCPDIARPATAIDVNEMIAPIIHSPAPVCDTFETSRLKPRPFPYWSCIQDTTAREVFTA